MYNDPKMTQDPKKRVSLTTEGRERLRRFLEKTGQIPSEKAGRTKKTEEKREKA